MGFLIVILAVVAAVFFRQSGVHRSRNGEFAGICSGLSKHYELNVTAVRILFFVCLRRWRCNHVHPALGPYFLKKPISKTADCSSV